jgi:hypothetical protein
MFHVKRFAEQSFQMDGQSVGLCHGTVPQETGGRCSTWNSLESRAAEWFSTGVRKNYANTRQVEVLFHVEQESKVFRG